MPELNWVGKDKVITHHLDVPYRVLDRQYSFDETGQHEADNGSENMIIHGDNLEALKALLPKYEGKVDCIYIDPPYNTGNEGWVYNDNVNDPRIRKWLGDVVGKEGEDLTRHDKWLCMMYPRIRLLHRLLAQSGVIFISIDDTEASNLKLLCDEIFGIQNFLSMQVWKSKSGGANDSRNIAIDHEYVLTYSKDPSLFQLHNDMEAKATTAYSRQDERGRYALERLDKQNLQYSASLDYEIVGPDGSPYRLKHKNPASPNAIWRWSKSRVQEQYADLVFHNGHVYTKNYEKKDGQVPRSILVDERFGRSRTGGTDLRKVLGAQKVFSYPKPIALIEYLLTIGASPHSLILDSFAGSGTTAHAVLKLNSQDGGNRKFILCEMEDYANDITAERTRRVICGDDSGHRFSRGTGGSFSFYELGKPLIVGGGLNPSVSVDKLREYVWFTETAETTQPDAGELHPDFLGRSGAGVSYFFAYHPVKASTLDREYLATIPEACGAESYVIYADACLLSEQELNEFGITFKKIPRDITRL